MLNRFKVEETNRMVSTTTSITPSFSGPLDEPDLIISSVAYFAFTLLPFTLLSFFTIPFCSFYITT